jgi:hypothetical protein
MDIYEYMDIGLVIDFGMDSLIEERIGFTASTRVR